MRNIVCSQKKEKTAKKKTKEVKYCGRRNYAERNYQSVKRRTKKISEKRNLVTDMQSVENLKKNNSKNVLVRLYASVLFLPYFS